MAPQTEGTVLGDSNHGDARTVATNATRPLVKGPTKAPEADKRSPRFVFWLAFKICSLIVMGSSVEAVDRVQFHQRGVTNQKWAVWCATISFILNLGVVMLHMNPVGSLFIVGTPKEGILLLISCGLWSALVAAISDAGNGLAVDDRGVVVFGNLYYFAWAGFGCAMYMSFSYLQTRFNLDVHERMDQRSRRLNLWAALTISHLILMSSAANVWDYSCGVVEDMRGSRICNRTLFALILGTVGAAFGIVVCGMKASIGKAPLLLESVLASVIFTANAYGVALVTGEKGPGAGIGNLYYFSWISLLSAFFTMVRCSEALTQRKEQQKANAQSRMMGGDEESYTGRSQGTYTYAGGETQSYAGTYDSRTHGGDTRTYGGDTRTYGDDTRSYGGDTRTYGGDTRTYGGDTQSYAGTYDSRTYGGDTRSYGGDTRTYGGDTRTYADDGMTYADDGMTYADDNMTYDMSRKGDDQTYVSEGSGSRR